MLAWLAFLTVAVVWGSTYFAIALGIAGALFLFYSL